MLKKTTFICWLLYHVSKLLLNFMMRGREDSAMTKGKCIQQHGDSSSETSKLATTSWGLATKCAASWWQTMIKVIDQKRDFQFGKKSVLAFGKILENLPFYGFASDAWDSCVLLGFVFSLYKPSLTGMTWLIFSRWLKQIQDCHEWLNLETPTHDEVFKHQGIFAPWWQ